MSPGWSAWADLSRPDAADLLRAAQAVPGGRVLAGVRRPLLDGCAALGGRVSGIRSGKQVASTLARFATVVPDEAWTELDA